MQLRKQSIRKMPTFDSVKVPEGIHRNPADYNQKNNRAQRNRNVRGDQF